MSYYVITYIHFWNHVKNINFSLQIWPTVNYAVRRKRHLQITSSASVRPYISISYIRYDSWLAERSSKYRAFIKYCVFPKIFRKFQTLAFLCFPLVSVLSVQPVLVYRSLIKYMCVSQDLYLVHKVEASRDSWCGPIWVQKP